MKTQTGVPNSPQAGLAGGAKLKNAGFRSPAQKMDFLDLLFIHNLSWCKIGPFCLGDWETVWETYLCSLGPSIQRKKNWGKRTRLARITSDSMIYLGSTSAWGCLMKAMLQCMGQRKGVVHGSKKGCCAWGKERVLCMSQRKGVVHGARNGSRHGVA